MTIDIPEWGSTDGAWNGVDNSYAEVENGAVRLSPIPAGVIDNFETDDTDPRGVYMDGETLSDYYTTIDGSLSRTTSNVVEGGYALLDESADATAPNYILSFPGDGLNRYPDNGETFAWLARDNGYLPGPIFDADPTNGITGYAPYINASADEIRVGKLTDGSNSNIASAAVTLSADTWYWGECRLPSSSDATIDFTLYEVDTTDLTRGTQIANCSVTDSDYIDYDGVGAISLSAASGSYTTIDWMRVI